MWDDLQLDFLIGEKAGTSCKQRRSVLSSTRAKRELAIANHSLILACANTALEKAGKNIYRNTQLLSMQGVGYGDFFIRKSLIANPRTLTATLPKRQPTPSKPNQQAYEAKT